MKALIRLWCLISKIKKLFRFDGIANNVSQLTEELDKQNNSTLPKWLNNLNKSKQSLDQQIKKTVDWVKSLSTSAKVLGGVGLAIGAGLAIYSAVQKHLEELRVAGINLDEPETVKSALKVFDETIDELAELLK